MSLSHIRIVYYYNLTELHTDTLKGTLTPNNVARESPFDHDGSTFPT